MTDCISLKIHFLQNNNNKKNTATIQIQNHDNNWSLEKAISSLLKHVLLFYVFTKTTRTLLTFLRTTRYLFRIFLIFILEGFCFVEIQKNKKKTVKWNRRRIIKILTNGDSFLCVMFIKCAEDANTIHAYFLPHKDPLSHIHLVRKTNCWSKKKWACPVFLKPKLFLFLWARKVYLHVTYDVFDNTSMYVLFLK